MKHFSPSHCRLLSAVGIVGGAPEEKKHIIQHMLSAKHLHNGIVVQGHDTNALASFIQTQHELVKQERTIGSRRFCIIEEPTESQDFVNLMRNTSYLCTSVFLPSDEIVNMQPHIRANIDCVVVSKNINTRLKKKVYEFFGGIFKDFKTFDLTLTQCKSWMVFYFGNPSNKLEDNVFYYDSVV
jgi:hypothetical protein